MTGWRAAWPRPLFGIPAVKGVEFGAGFDAARSCGSENNDAFRIEHGAVVTETNHAGGILGGITTGMPLVLRAAFKPTPSIAKPQQTVSLSAMENTQLQIGAVTTPASPTGLSLLSRRSPPPCC